MDYESDDSLYDPDYYPSDGNATASSESDSANENWNPPLFFRRASTFTESDLPPLPEVQRRISARRMGNTDLDAYNMPSKSSATISILSTSATTLTTGNNEPSLSGTTSECLKQNLDSIEWHMPTQEGSTPMEYTGPISGFKEIYSGILANASPIDYFDLFIINDIIQHIVDQTNLYATQQLLSNDIPSGSRQHAWVPVTLDEKIINEKISRTHWLDGIGEAAIDKTTGAFISSTIFH
ncbi:unnamed protein product [Parnassius apollo]|uniref:(apollo) hypothetical protein n=1 Tax=Parnassius apollo TaxID=110799 RepID=A0A8S3WDL5_PARAO|nr:unnamed protein product [Parnassius apollo]